MSRALLDVNVLLALLWPGHTAHGAAMAWFGKTGRKAWATNPLVQLGVLRLLTNPTITQGAVSAPAALEVLAGATRHEGHEFWPLDQEVTAALSPISASLTGYRQWADALLLEQAAERGGLLVTFDSGFKELAAGNKRGRVLLLDANSPSA
jgi:toxin-antitoxin system PIN domain toxin